MPLARNLALWGLLQLGASGVALAAEDDPSRPALPSWSMAGDDGAPALWRSPGNLGLDPDPSWAVLYGRQGPESGFSAAGSTGPLGMGLAYRSTDQDGVINSWWLVSTGIALRLDRHLAAGVHMGWQMPGDAGNFVTWDLGLTWRPLPWLGLAGVARNVGVDGRQGLQSRIGPGLVLRPLGDQLQLGLDVLGSSLDDSDQRDLSLTATLRYEPIEGLVIRASGDEDGRIGAGLEAYFGRVGAGAHALVPTSGTGDVGALAYARNTRPRKKLIAGEPTVAIFKLDEAYPYQNAGGLLAQRGETWLGLIQRIERAVDDPKVGGLVLQIDGVPLSLSRVEELRVLVAEARAKGKPVLAWLDRSSSNAALLLATSADRVYLHPAGGIDLIGLSAETMYFKGLFDLVGVEAQFAKRSEYKSSPEGNTQYGSSPASREQLNALLDDLSEHYIAKLGADRSRTPDQVRSLIDGGPYSAKGAEDKGLVDGLCYEDELGDKVRELLGSNFNADTRYGDDIGVDAWRGRHEIAVIYIDGVITGGPTSPPGLLSGGWSSGAETVSRQLMRAAREDTVRAVVLRVDSPGGSAFASDEIWRAVELVKRRGKPVVVSMGDTAASGGYYVAAGATAIYASPTTVTGSIGVYSGKFNAEGLFETLGINTELHTRGRKAGMYTTSRPMDEVELAAMDRMVGETYDQFKERVGTGRSLEPEAVEEVARGRVWSGKAAKDKGLVDELGGFRAAIARASSEAGLPEDAELALVTYDYRLGPRDEVSRGPTNKLRDRLGLRAPAVSLPSELVWLERWRQLEHERVLALMPYEVEVR